MTTIEIVLEQNNYPRLKEYVMQLREEAKSNSINSQKALDALDEIRHLIVLAFGLKQLPK